MSGNYENELLHKIEDMGWVGIRAAGSTGKGDLIAINPESDNSPAIVEVKKVGTTDKFYPYRNQYNEQQFVSMQEHARKGITTMYAVRFTRGNEETRWQIYYVSGSETEAQYRRGEGETIDEAFGGNN